VPRGRASAAQHRHIDTETGQHQRNPEQCDQHECDAARPPARKLIAYRDGKEDDQQTGNNERRNLRPTVRPACQRARPGNLLAAHEFIVREFSLAVWGFVRVRA
jgi:hypothetical protein